ncbi:FAD-binding oxidoreductase [Hyphomicrobium sp.]|uniref:FAD-binding oxidoreductase n=1 Tax=Hyphomicrobium sp. TaxID=82 RepID=UPI000F99A536|nr:FAD-binding oxidoreductase [Hyphomicrobium sp.]RUO98548.1 MAG: FAD-binding oxidoreductase [Hyphomicrobium sp.]
MHAKAPSPNLIARFVDIVGEANALTRAEDQVAYLREWRDRYVGRTPVVLRPVSTAEVARILSLAHAEDVGIVPQGGNTGLVGGQIPSSDGRQIVLSLSRLKAIRDVDAVGGTMIVESGVTLTEAQSAAKAAGRLFPLSLASEGSAQIGGVLSSNAGGTAVLAYGNARSLALGLEAVLADGRIWNGLRRLKKDNTGYDLRDLLIGSEGTLGIITAACLKLFPMPAERETAIVAFQTPEAIMKLFRRAEVEAGQSLTAFEFWADRAQEFALKYMANMRDPFTDAYPWYALIEISHGGKGNRVANTIESLLAAAHGQGLILDATIARSLRQAEDFWRLRESFSEAQKGAGGSIKHDISVPVTRIPEFLKQAADVVERIAPGARPVPFGHFGDGNLHYNVTQPLGADRNAYLALWEPMTEAIFALVTEFGGSISAEHGIGQMKREALRRHKSEVELDMMRAIKTALDPKGILNPGKVL